MCPPLPVMRDVTIEDIASRLKETSFFFFDNELELSRTLRYHAAAATGPGSTMHDFAHVAYLHNNVTYDLVPNTEIAQAVRHNHVAYLLEVRCKHSLRMKTQTLGMVSLWIKLKGKKFSIDMDWGFAPLSINPKQTPTRQCPTVMSIDVCTEQMSYDGLIKTLSPNTFTSDDEKIDEYLYVAMVQATMRHLQHHLSPEDRQEWEHFADYLYVMTKTPHGEEGEATFPLPKLRYQHLFTVCPTLDSGCRIDVFINETKRLVSFTFGLGVDVTGALHFKQITSVEDLPYQAFPV